MVFLRRDDEEEDAEVPEDEDAALADDVLDEVEGDGDDISESDDIEGFGLIEESGDEEKEEEEEEEESLEDDAEDVDFDTFDDVDEM